MSQLKLRRSLLQMAAFALALNPLASFAQEASSQEKVPMVRSVKVKSEGGLASEQFVLGFVSLRAGEPFTQEKSTSTVKALYATGRFNQASVIPQLDAKTGEVDLVILVEPRPIITKFEYIGGEGLFDKESEDRFADGLRVGEPLDMAALRRAEVKLQDDIRKKHPFTSVSAQTYTAPGGGVVVSYVIREGANLRVDNIIIKGVEQLSADEVIEGADLKATNWRWWKF
jgi:outer membrane protein insertion porin family